MELQLSPEKTHIRHYNDGFDFLGFTISSRGASMRQKSEEKLKTTIRNITKRSNNLDQQVCDKLNQVIRGTVNYFYTRFSTVKTQFNRIDQWIRRRIRLMKFKRTWATDNRRLKNKHIERMGILSCKKLGEAKLLC
jgi:RNA-directed DNA polymerase